MMHLNALPSAVPLAAATGLLQQLNVQLYLPWIVSTAIIVLGVFIYGWDDLKRIALSRVWAIAGICQTEALRKKILWVTPLAIIGVIVISQFQGQMAPDDAIRQTTKFSLFASSMLVTITAIILACTNLPREIESRVIFTIVTKPTTRLEIVLGKIVGFARISALIILIMGLFTLAYLKYRAMPMLADLREDIKSRPVDSPLRVRNQYFVDTGLLGTRSLDWSQNTQIYARPPEGGDLRWMGGGVGQHVLVPFVLTPDERAILREAADKGYSVYYKVDAQIEQHVPSEEERKSAQDLGVLQQAKITAPLGPSPDATPDTSTDTSLLIPQVAVQALDTEQRNLSTNRYDTGIPVQFAPSTDPAVIEHAWSGDIPKPMLEALSMAGDFILQVNGTTPATNFGFKPGLVSIVFYNQSKPQTKQLELNGKPVPPIVCARDPNDPNHPAAPEFRAYPARRGMHLAAASAAPLTAKSAGVIKDVHLPESHIVRGPAPTTAGSPIPYSGDLILTAYDPLVWQQIETAQKQLDALAADPSAASANADKIKGLTDQIAELKSRPGVPFLNAPMDGVVRLSQGTTLAGRAVKAGEVLGTILAPGPLAAFSFRNTHVDPDSLGKVALQIAVYIDRSGDFKQQVNESVGYDDASVQIHNLDPAIGFSPEYPFSPEVSRTEPVAIDAKYFAGGNFDVLVRNTTPNQFLGVGGGANGSVAVVAADRAFVVNLAKSLLVLWLLSILVVMIAVFCSTFLSWPIAVVLTLVILLSHWGVDQLGDALSPGASRNVVSGFGVRDVQVSFVVTTGLERLSAILRTISVFLPDVSQFAISEDIQRGVSIPPLKVLQSLGVLFCYGLPMLVFSYVILRRKEVAP